MKKEFLIGNLDTGLSYEVNLKNEVIKKLGHIKKNGDNFVVVLQKLETIQ
jgi:hypothetical protein